MEELQEAVRGAASSNRRCLWFVSVFCPLSARHFSSLLDEVMKWLLLLLHLLPLHLLTVLHQLARFFGAAVKLSRNGLWLDEDGEETSARVSDLLTQLKASISHFLEAGLRFHLVKRDSIGSFLHQLVPSWPDFCTETRWLPSVWLMFIDVM